MSPAREQAPSPDLGSPKASHNQTNRALGDRQASAGLRLIDNGGVTFLNDRRIPGSKSTIELIAVSPAGVFVIGTKSYKGLVHTRRHGRMGNLGPVELHVGRRNCTSSVEDLGRQVEAVRQAFGATPRETEVPINALLCLTRAEWGFASPIEVGDVWVGWPRLMTRRLRGPEVMDSPTVREVSETIAGLLP